MTKRKKSSRFREKTTFKGLYSTEIGGILSRINKYLTIFEPERPARQAQDGNESLIGPTDSPEEPKKRKVTKIGQQLHSN